MLAAVAITAGLLCARYGRPGYDTAYALAWGRDLHGGHGLQADALSVPTAHPLSVTWGVLLGSMTPGIAQTITLFATGLCAVALAGVLAGIARASAPAGRAGGVVRGRWLEPATVALLAALSPALLLLALAGSADVGFVLLAAAGVLATLHGRTGLAAALLTAAALQRPEVALLLLIPLWSRLGGTQHAAARRHCRGLLIITGASLLAISAAWLLTGALAGDPLNALRSAAGNATLNDNPRGPATALRHLLPDLASAWGWAPPAAAALAFALGRTPVSTHRPGRPGQRHTPPGRPRVFGPAARARAARTRHGRPVLSHSQCRDIVAASVALAALAYLAQGLLSTPLVARYVLLPAVLCLPLAAALPGLIAGHLYKPGQMRDLPTVRTLGLGVLTGVVLLGATLPGWTDLTSARQEQNSTLKAARDLLDNPLVDRCPRLTVRSPALLPVLAAQLDRPLGTIEISSGARPDGVLLQPLTNAAALLRGYGPPTPLAEQAQLPTGLSLRASNKHWALYSTCR